MLLSGTALAGVRGISRRVSECFKKFARDSSSLLQPLVDSISKSLKMSASVASLPKGILIRQAPERAPIGL